MQSNLFTGGGYVVVVERYGRMVDADVVDRVGRKLSPCNFNEMITIPLIPNNIDMPGALLNQKWETWENFREISYLDKIRKGFVNTTIVAVDHIAVLDHIASPL